MFTQLGQACHALRYLYYCKAISLVPDDFYDTMEKVAISKGDTTLDETGSSLEDSYNYRIKDLAQSFQKLGTKKLMGSILKNEGL